jgi:predicted glutamine amidotransferase
MCRWLGYVGSPIEPRELLYDPERSLIEQSRRHAPDMPVPNGDGFGLGWYGRREEPALFHSASPAWGDRNLRTLAAEVSSPLFLAHVRAATGTPVQETNCHPFASGRWMFVHNGFIAGYERLRRDLVLAVRPDLFPGIEGTTDSEVMFHLALTFGLEEDPPAAVARVIGLVEQVGREHGVEHPFQGTIATSDGECIWAFRYSSERQSRSLYYSTDVRTLRAMYPENELLREVGDEARLIVSEPLGDALPGAWNKVPESTYGVIQPGQDEIHPFTPVADPVARARA